MTKPTIIFAPGAWYPPTAFDPLIEKLSPDGYKCHRVAFPAIQKATEVKDLSQDIAAVRALAEPAVNAGEEVVVVAHSWAGLPVSSALEGLSKTHREKAGKTGGVVKICYISAFIPEVGQSLLGALGGVPPDWWVDDKETGTTTTTDPLGLFFHDVPDGQKWVEQIRPHAKVTKESPATAAAYLHIPCSYLLCEDDRAIPLFVQELMVEKARKKGAVFVTEKINTAHTPWLVDADRVADYIRRHACGV